MSESTKTIAQRVAATHIRKTVQAAIGQTQARPTKTAASDSNFFAVVDKQGWRKIRQALQKDGDTASVKLWDEATRDIAKAMELPSRTDMALTKMLNLIDQGPRDPGMTRNAVFKIADLLGIKMPHGIFASTDKQTSGGQNLPTRDGSVKSYSVSSNPGVWAHVWFDKDVARTDAGNRAPHSGEWQVVVTTSEDPLNQRPRGRELAREVFRYVEKKTEAQVYRHAKDFVQRQLSQRRRLAASDGVSIDDMGIVFVRRDAHAMLTEREAKTHWDLVNKVGSKVSAALKKAGIPHKRNEARLSHDRLMRWQQMVVPNASLSSQSRDERNALIEQISAALDANNIPYGFYQP